MSKQSKSKSKKPNGSKVEEDDDWENVLEAEMIANNIESKSLINQKITSPTKVNAELKEEVEVDDDDNDADAQDNEGAGASKDKKKKKKKNKKDKEEKKEPEKISAAGKAILLRQQQLAEEEARLKKLQEEEEARIKAEEEEEERRLRAIEEEKERKRKAKQDKVEAQKAAGTYMTKSEKEKARKQKERLEAMKKSQDLLIPGVTNVSPVLSTSTTNTSNELKQIPDSKLIVTDKFEAVTSNLVPIPEAQEKEPTAETDDWDSGDWESSADLLVAKVSELVVTSKVNQQEEADELQADDKAEQARLRQLGIERAKREEEARLKKELEDKEREELARKEREIAMRKENSKRRRLERENIAKLARSSTNLRAPISVIMGHVDTGKTKLLDKIRHTNVQEGEAGGITQQIGATQFPKETLEKQTHRMQTIYPFEIQLPGLLMIDTPGHESFTNLRNRGSSLCDIAILVIDLMHGLEPQTIESLNMLRRKETPFIVALNKVDRCYGWKTMPDYPIQEALAIQDENCRLEFKDRTNRTILQLNEQGLNAKLYWENDDPLDTISLVPTSAMSGEGIPDLLYNLIKISQERLVERLMYMEYVQCTVLEVKAIDGLGFTVDVVLLNGTLHEGETIVVSTLEGPVVTNIRALLTPPPNREIRVKSEYIHHASLHGAIGVKIVAPDIGRAIAGTPLMVVHPEDDLEELMEECQSDLARVTKSLTTDARGVTVHASTLGALEALLQFLREDTRPPIPVCHVSIGPVNKKDVVRTSIALEKGQPEFAVILAFDVRVDAEAQGLADELKVRIFTADIIYHLFDQFTAHLRALAEARRAAAELLAVHPCVLRILPQHIFNKKDPIVLGVEVLEGTLRLGTPLCVPGKGLDIGRVISIENNHKEVTVARRSLSVSVKIVNEADPSITYGRHFDASNTLYSKLTRQSIDALKEFFKDDVSKEDWALVVKLKKVFNIQ